MNRFGTALAVVFALLLVGCARSPAPRTPQEADEFGPQTMRLHPIFTRVLERRPDDPAGSVLALVELVDAYGDPTKSMGRAMLELFEYRPREAEPRGPRVGGPWVFPLDDRDRQVSHWNRITGAYEFRLDVPEMSRNRAYILAAQFDTASGRRFFSQIVLTPTSGEMSVAPTDSPTTLPAR